jgi:mono/diheme cytochrome c family protein
MDGLHAVLLKGFRRMSRKQGIDRASSLRSALAAWLCFAFATVVSAADKPADGSSITPEQAAFFEKDVLPLLKENCFKCHGGEAKIKGGLNLTSRAGLIKGGDIGSAIDFKTPEKSLLLEMISYKDGDHEMPPTAKLADDKIEVLTKWVKMGVPWPGDKGGPAAHHEGIKIDEAARNWWAYRKLTRPTTPLINSPWIKSPIDAFILQKLHKSNLKPVGPAPKAALLRRAYYDLIGLPPTPEEVDAFVADTSPLAFNKVIDKLLAMPQYGEKWGRHWLDLVRYAETNGYERDGTKPFAWRYRDYVIDAFNKDKPYDQFLREQLAGDELDEVTAETITATGYFRLGIWDDEPVDRLQARFDVLDDVVSTTSQVMLGMTVGCARCHDHKKDPIPQKDYYRLLAFFGDVTDYGNGPTVEVAAGDAAAAAAKEEARRAQRAQQVRDEITAIETTFITAGEKAGLKLRAQLAVKPKEVAILAADSREKGQEWRYTTTKPEGMWNAQAYDDSKWKKGPGGFGTQGTPGAVVRTTWNTSEIWLRRAFGLKDLPGSLTLRIHHDEEATVFLNGKQVAKLSGHTVDYITVPIEGKASDFVHLGSNVIAVNCKQTGGGQYIDLAITDQADPVSVASLIKEHGGKLLTKEQREQYAALTKEEDQLRKAPPPSKGMPVLAVSERPQPAMYVMIRGSVHAKGDEVKPGFPAVLGFADPVLPTRRTSRDTGGKRRALAEWMTSKENPMPARAMANRLWQHHFGRGLCRSSNDFGKLGELPTHPELLDWLASEFQAQNWSMKRMHRIIMLSSAYQMASSDDAEGLRLDPGNDLYWRFDMRRLGAEEFRDSILAVNGSLNLKMGGPSMFTEVPASVLQTSSTPNSVWGKSPPAEQARRSVYIFVKRSLVEPILSAFDLADTDSSCAVRFATTVPTQSLSTLNSDFFNKQAAIFAARLRKEAGAKIEDQAALGIRLVTGRAATAAEVKRCVTLYSDLQTKDGIAADKALDYVCLVLLNLNEFVYLD